MESDIAYNIESIDLVDKFLGDVDDSKGISNVYLQKLKVVWIAWSLWKKKEIFLSLGHG